MDVAPCILYVFFELSLFQGITSDYPPYSAARWDFYTQASLRAREHHLYHASVA